MRIFIIVLLVTLVAGGLVVYRILQSESLNEMEVSSSPAPVAKATPAAAPAPPVLPHAEEIQAQAVQAPTPEDEEDEAQIDAEQVLEALESLKSTDPEERVAGVEQLAAFPTAEAEQQLLITLAGDSSADVRSAAAQSLGQFENLSDGIMTALLKALEDQDEDVQVSALDAIESLVSDMEANEPRLKQVLSTLKKLQSSKKLRADTRQGIKEFLEDQ
ncbi:HEAT repeat domain-containing protein [Methyloterricola oryzae]|uniref:HEAT repeat domain-containing protein n=1 Tax=Methyloterricola oryzae TaxID=1495050 RepID=UPI0005EB6E3B|nr:HEAT repeat domain-containing protein [Methyloterricola oryzae]